MGWVRDTKTRSYHKARFMKLMAEHIKGWTVCIFLCADNTFYTRLCRNLLSMMKDINEKHKGIYFKNHPERLPAKLIYVERHLPFREAYAKFKSLKDTDKYPKEYLYKNKLWCINSTLRDFYFNHAPIEFIDRSIPKEAILENLKRVNRVQFDRDWRHPVEIFSPQEEAMAAQLGRELEKKEPPKSSVEELMPRI